MESARTLTPEQRSTRARLAAFALHASGQTYRPRRGDILGRFERQVDPEGLLPPDERARRAEWAMRSHMAGLALKASQARARRRPRGAGPPDPGR